MFLSVFLVALFTFAARAEDSEISEVSSEEFNNNEEPQRYEKALTDCSIKYNVTQDYFSLVLTGEAPEDENEKCFVKCGMEALDYLNEDGSLNEQVLRAVIQRFFTEPNTRDLAISAWLSCEKLSQSEQYADDSCDRAFNMFVCYSDNMSKGSIPATP